MFVSVRWAGLALIACVGLSFGQSSARAQVPATASEQVGNDAVPKFAQDVTLHVVLHELAHALVREFDIPILGNEETVADAFATFYLTTYLRDRAPAVLKARIKSLMIEANEVARADWTVKGEHNNDARRAYQIAAIAIAADAKKYRNLADMAGMSESQINASADYGAEIHRSWRRTLKPMWLPEGSLSNEFRLRLDPSCPIVAELKKSGVTNAIASAAKRFDWHSQVTISFAEGDGGAAWNRSKRTITVKSDYVRRFVRQAKLAEE
jgi:hypothetical protein